MDRFYLTNGYVELLKAIVERALEDVNMPVRNEKNKYHYNLPLGSERESAVWFVNSESMQIMMHYITTWEKLKTLKLE